MIKCGTCEGNGALLCSQCEGKGEVLGTGKHCSLCKGVGVIRCEACQGKGLSDSPVSQVHDQPDQKVATT